MKNYTKIAVCLLLAMAGTAWPSTFFITTHIQVPLTELEQEEKIRVISLETGVMDYLFDNNHIFFNSYNIDSSEEDNLSFSQMMVYAKEFGADYLVELTPEETGASWSLHGVSNSITAEKFYEDIPETEKNARERWIDFGHALGKNLLHTLTDQ
ncbi:MAG: hypothetical protein B0D92_02465 [Spirochaeta sp. LUC14_002_19_P3]|nr:MAG: hypothetical protein B0D92_02465 [Spirochaeta sp. LUC14_002_19_P3]